ncbi:hypothetical protein BDF21DRAFT_432563 [Thamnidium elegans]|uniref:magnesium chelatase n=1 Tax=Thamnidium elegans TaxID=101142 RepID=A0A8H7ST20_9FUNG|nr:hypothetical protein INT48_005955 [Thamnidium elegans]KAI8050755.1 hypothetical protein BDF21DRAFT_432563 [Thamnidium elegans]
MSQDSKEWIKTRMAILKKQAGFAFNQDLFISILLCLISGRDKHLILTAPPNRLGEVTQMASQISRGLFGFTTAKMTCSEYQTRSDLIDSLFNTREDLENSIDKLNGPLVTLKNKVHDTTIHSHKASRSIQTLDSRTSDRSQTSNTGSRNTSIKFSLMVDEDHSTPISPVDFNLRKRDRPPFIFSRTNTSTPVYANSILQKEISNHKRDRSRWSENEDLKRSYASSTTSNKLAQTLIMQNLDSANESIQALLLELIVMKELKMANVRYNVPKPFLVIAVLPQGYNRLSISSQLLDRFFVSYNFEEDMFLHTNLSMLNPPVRQTNLRRHSLMKHDEIRGLTERASNVHVNIDITRYIRDIVVGIRTHPRVKGGLTARCSQDLVTVTKSLATLFERDYLTPDLVTIAAEKVFSHRLHVLAINTHDDQMEKEDMDSNLPSDIVSEIIRVVYVPV